MRDEDAANADPLAGENASQGGAMTAGKRSPFESPSVSA